MPAVEPVSRNARDRSGALSEPAWSRDADPRIRTIMVEVPTPLYLAAKAEARAQGLTIREVVMRHLEAWIRGSLAWRRFLADAAQRDEAKARGKLPRAP